MARDDASVITLETAWDSDRPVPSTLGPLGLDHGPPSLARRAWNNLRGLRGWDNGIALIVRPYYARAGRSVTVRHKLSNGEQAQLQIGNKPSYEVGNGRTEFIPTAGLTRIMLRQGSPETSCEVTMRAFDAPRLERLAWEGPLTVAKPATIYWSVVNAVNVRVQIEQRNRQIFDSASPTFSLGDQIDGTRGKHTVQFEYADDVVVRLTAENPGAPWLDLRRRVFTVIEPVAPLVPFFQQVSVPPQAYVTEDIPIRWRVSGASKITLHWTHAGTTCEQELPPSGETQVVATTIAPIDLRFTADPALPTLPGPVSAPETHDMREQPICRRIEIRALPPRIEFSRQVIRGYPLSHQALAYQIHDASEAWLIRPHRNQTTEIRLAGVMSFWLGTVVETITIMARSESGEESIKVITLRPYRGFFRRIFDVSL